MRFTIDKFVTYCRKYYKQLIVLLVLITLAIAACFITAAKFSSTLNTPDNVKLEIEGHTPYAHFDSTTHTLSFCADNEYNPDTDWKMKNLEEGQRIPAEVIVQVHTVTFKDEFKYYQPSNTAHLLEGATSLTAVNNIGNLNTGKITSMESMFEGCTSLSELDLCSFNVPASTIVKNMFYGDAALKTIYSEKSWNVTGDSTNMFSGCSAIQGGNGKLYDESLIDISAARLDAHGDGNEGYFTAKGDKALKIEYVLENASWPASPTVVHYDQYVEAGKSVTVQGAHKFDDPIPSSEYVFKGWKTSDGTIYEAGDELETSSSQTGTITLTSNVRTPIVTVKVNDEDKGLLDGTTQEESVSVIRNSSATTTRDGVESTIKFTTSDSNNAEKNILAGTNSVQCYQSGQFEIWTLNKPMGEEGATEYTGQQFADDTTIYANFVDGTKLWRYTLDQLSRAAEDIEENQTDSKYKAEFDAYVQNGLDEHGLDNSTKEIEDAHWAIDFDGHTKTEWSSQALEDQPECEEFRIIGTLHDEKIDGTKAGITLMTTHASKDDYQIQWGDPTKDETTVGGWYKSYARNNYIYENKAFVNNKKTIPASLFEKGVSVKKTTGYNNPHQNPGVVSDYEKIWIPSFYELTGTTSGYATSRADNYRYDQEGTQYYAFAFKGKVKADSSNGTGLEFIDYTQDDVDSMTSSRASHKTGVMRPYERSLGNRKSDATHPAAPNNVVLVMTGGDGDSNPDTGPSTPSFVTGNKGRSITPCICLGKQVKDLRDYTLDELKEASYDIAVNGTGSKYFNAFANFAKYGITNDGRDNCTGVIETTHWAIDKNGRTFSEAGFDKSNCREFRVIGLNQENLQNPNEKAGITLMLTHSIGNEIKFSDQQYSTTGWGTSNIKNELNSDLGLYTALNAACATCVKKYSTVSGKSSFDEEELANNEANAMLEDNTKVWPIGWSEMTGNKVPDTNYDFEYYTDKGRYLAFEDIGFTDNNYNSLSNLIYKQNGSKINNNVNSFWTRSPMTLRNETGVFQSDKTVISCYNSGVPHATWQSTPYRTANYCICIKGEAPESSAKAVYYSQDVAGTDILAGDLRFYYDDQKYTPGQGGVGLMCNITDGVYDSAADVPWLNQAGVVIKRVMFDSSFSGYDNITSTAHWFEGADWLSVVKTQNLNMSNIVNMDSMFKNANKLQTIYTDSGTNWDNGFRSGNNMFDGCTSLYGGCGTTLQSDHSIAKAHVDQLNSEDGYLTSMNTFVGVTNSDYGSTKIDYSTATSINTNQGAVHFDQANNKLIVESFDVDGSNHEINAVAGDEEYFDHFEYSTDNGTTWTRIETGDNIKIEDSILFKAFFNKPKAVVYTTTEQNNDDKSNDADNNSVPEVAATEYNDNYAYADEASDEANNVKHIKFYFDNYKHDSDPGFVAEYDVPTEATQASDIPWAADHAATINEIEEDSNFASWPIWENAPEDMTNFWFKGFTSIKTVVVPNYFTTLGTSTFEGCENLKKVVVGDLTDRKLTFVGDNAFKNCEKLENYVVNNATDASKVSISYGNNVFDGAGTSDKSKSISLIFASSTNDSGTHEEATRKGLTCYAYTPVTTLAQLRAACAAHSYAILANDITFGELDEQVKVSGQAFVDLNGKTIDRNLSASKLGGRSFFIQDNAVLRIDDSSCISTGDTPNPNLGKITGGYANGSRDDDGFSGGAFYVDGTLDFVNGNVTGNRSNSSGGAISMKARTKSEEKDFESTVNLYGNAYLYENYTTVTTELYGGAGIYVQDGSTFNMYGGHINKNYCSTEAVHARGAGLMSNCGANATYPTKIRLYGGEIKNNTDANKNINDVCINVEMTDIEYLDMIAYDNCDFEMFNHGVPKFKVENGTATVVGYVSGEHTYHPDLPNGYATTIPVTVPNPAGGSDVSVVGIDANAFKEDTNLKKVVIEERSSTFNIGDAAFEGCSNLENFVDKCSANIIKYGNDCFKNAGTDSADRPKLILTGASTSQTATQAGTGQDFYVFTPITKSKYTAIGEETPEVAKLAFNSKKYFYLTCDCESDDPDPSKIENPSAETAGAIQAAGNSVLDLNSHKLDRHIQWRDGTTVFPYGFVVNVVANANFRLDNSRCIQTLYNSNGKLTGGYARNTGTSDGCQDGGGICCHGNIQLVNGSVCDNKAYRGGGICLIGSASLNMYGGLITGNCAYNTAILKDGKYADGSTAYGGGVYVRTGSHMNMYGGQIIRNFAVMGSSSLDQSTHWAYGGAIALWNSNADENTYVNIYKGLLGDYLKWDASTVKTFVGNEATTNAGAFYLTGNADTSTPKFAAINTGSYTGGFCYYNLWGGTHSQSSERSPQDDAHLSGYNYGRAGGVISHPIINIPQTLFDNHKYRGKDANTEIEETFSTLSSAMPEEKIEDNPDEGSSENSGDNPNQNSDDSGNQNNQENPDFFKALFSVFIPTQ